MVYRGQDNGHRKPILFAVPKAGYVLFSSSPDYNTHTWNQASIMKYILYDVMVLDKYVFNVIFITVLGSFDNQRSFLRRV